MKYFAALCVAIVLLIGYLINSGSRNYASKLYPVLLSLHKESETTIHLFEKLREIRNVALVNSADCSKQTRRSERLFGTMLLIDLDIRELPLNWEYRLWVPDARIATTGWLFQGFRHSLVFNSVNNQLEADTGNRHGDLRLTRRGRREDIWDYRPHPTGSYVSGMATLPIAAQIDASFLSEIQAIAVIRPTEHLRTGTYYDDWGKSVGVAYDMLSHVCIFSYPDFELLETQSFRTNAPFSKTWMHGLRDIQHDTHQLQIYRFMRSKLNDPDIELRSAHLHDYEIEKQILRDLKSKHEGTWVQFHSEVELIAPVE